MKILYGVPGEGMGHATRSKVVIDFLKQEHDVMVVSSAKAYQFLSKAFPGQVHEIKGFHFSYKDSEISKIGTFGLNLKKGPANLVHNFSKYLTVKKKFLPDLVISDFESFSWLYAKQHRLPLISIDNMQVMDRCKLDITIPASERTNYKLAKAIVQAKVPGADHYFVTSFFDAEIKKKNTTIVPPIVRKVIAEAKPSWKEHVLMYQTSSTLKTVRDVLHQFPKTIFYVYGFNKDEKDKNVVFKTFSEAGFVEDLASARAVISNGGFSLISEAVYLHKPVYSFPIGGQFEQFMNAAYIEKLGYGLHFGSLNAHFLRNFLGNEDEFRKNLSNYKQNGNKILFNLIQKKLSEIK